MSLALAALAASTVLTGCTSQADQAAEALCSDFAWDTRQTDEANTARMRALINDYDYSEGISDVYDRARRQCPDAFVEYDEYAAQQERDEAMVEGDPDVPAEPSPEVDTSIQDALDERGVTDDEVRRLGAMADRTGYGLGPGTTLPFDQAQNFAVVLILTCDQVAAGELTWDDAIAADVSTGAPQGAAREMNGYLRDVFCPGLS